MEVDGVDGGNKWLLKQIAFDLGYWVWEPNLLIDCDKGTDNGFSTFLQLA